MNGRVTFVSLMMVFIALAVGYVHTPVPSTVVAPDIDALLPDEFGEWRRVDLNAAILPAEINLGPGEAVAYRAYRDAVGRVVTLVTAYGPPLGDSVRLHRPESCYVAQGFAIRERVVQALEINGDNMPVIRLLTESSTRQEAVSYWLRDGNAYAESPSQHEFLSFKRGISTRADGALIRISSSGEGDAVFALHDKFIRSFTASLSVDARNLLLVNSQ